MKDSDPEHYIQITAMTSGSNNVVALGSCLEHAAAVYKLGWDRIAAQRRANQQWSTNY